MSRTNVLNRPAARTFEGGAGVPPKNDLHELRRAVGSCFLWEDQFYEDGVAIAERIRTLATSATVACPAVVDLAVEARTQMKLRHAPLWLLLAAFSRADKGVLDRAVEAVCQRADEMGELIALYWKDGKKPLPAAMKRGLAQAFGKFDAYQLGKYNRDKSAVSLKDILRLVHPKPKNEEQAALWKSVIDGTLASPDTWEVALSAGMDKKATFERLIGEGKLGYLALLRNLRNMQEAGCAAQLVNDAILARKGASNVFPFRFVAAARAAPQFEPALDKALQAQIAELPVLPGLTAVLVDVSYSMRDKLSARSDLRRMDAAAALASIVNGTLRVFTFSDMMVEIAPRRGMAGVDAVIGSQAHNGTYLGKAVASVNAACAYDRLIVVTDEQSADSVGAPLAGAHGYMINVASQKVGVGYGPWTRIDGFSENVLRFIAEHENRV